MNAANIKLQFFAVRRAPIPYLIAVFIAGGAAWSIARTADATSFANEAAALKTCDEHVSELQDRLAQSNQELEEFKKTVLTKIHAEALQLPPSFVSNFEEQLTTGLARIQKSNNDALYLGKSTGVIPLPNAMNAPQPNFPEVNPPAQKSITPLPQLR